MFRRVKSKNTSPQGTPSVFIGKVGGPFPAPRPANGNINLSSMNMNENAGSNSYMYINNGNRGYGYGYSDMGLDDYHALHYYGLDGLDNIDF